MIISAKRGPIIAPIGPVSPRQARLAMARTPYGDGTLLDAVRGAIDAAPIEVQLAWEYSVEWRRDDPAIAQIGAGLGLSDAQIDDLFRDAAAM